MRLLFLLVTFALCACAQKPVVKEPGSPDAGRAKAGALIAQPREPKPDNLPRQELEAETLYQFLLAEIAGQRGNLALSSQAYLEIAKRTRDPRVAKRAAEVATFSRDYELALEAASLWLELEPDSVAARQSIASVLVNSDDLKSAVPHLAKLLAVEGNNSGHGFLQLNNILAKHADKTAVLNAVKELAQPYRELAEAQFAIAQAAHNAGQHDAALAAIRQAAKLKPDWELAAVYEAQLLSRTSNTLAIEHLAKFLAAHPKAQEARLNFARLLVADRNYNAARAEFQKLMADFPDNADVVFAVALLSVQLKDYDAADMQFKQAMELGFKDADSIRLYLGQVAEERQRFGEAKQWYSAVLPGKHFLEANTRYAGIVAKQDGLPAGRMYLRSLPSSSEQEKVQYIQAEAQLLRDNDADQEAFQMLAHALEATPNHPDLLYDHAMAAERIDRLDVLETNLRRLIELKPDYAHAFNALGYTLADRTGRLDEAQQLIETALKLAPEDPFIMDSMGWVQYRRGNFDEGLQYLQRAFSSRPDPEIAAHLGEVLWVSGKRQEAQKIWREALRESPKNELLLNTIKRFVAERL
ncbi:MAG: tetratricopeptide repeat protein [Burkholderiales bacterium]